MWVNKKDPTNTMIKESRKDKSKNRTNKNSLSMIRVRSMSTKDKKSNKKNLMRIRMSTKMRREIK